MGRRVDSVLEQAWVYDGQLEPVSQLDGEGEVVMRFVYGSMPHVPDLIERGADTYRVVTDHLGSVRLVVNADTGVVAQRLEYGPWGEVLVDTNPGFQPFGLAGGIYDGDTGLVQFGAREYDAGLGRWISRDPVLFGGGMNLFAYAANDPVNLVDPTGNTPAHAGAGAAAGACAANPACAGAVVDGTWILLGALLSECVQWGLCFNYAPPEPDVEPFTPWDEPVCSDPWGGQNIPLEPVGEPFDKKQPPHNDTPDNDEPWSKCVRERQHCVIQGWTGDCKACCHKCWDTGIWPSRECHPDLAAL